MPVTPTYPGVYVEEIPSGVRTIVGVATSITAFVGRTRWGMTNNPVMCNSFGDFERYFGGLQEDYPLSYAVRDFFLNGGSQALIVRLTAPNFASDVQQASALAANQKAITAATTVSNTVKAAADLAGAKTDATAANTTIATDKTKSAGEIAAAQKVLDAVIAATSLDAAKAAATAAIPAAISIPGNASLNLPVSAKENLQLEAASAGIWGNSLRARIDYDGTSLVGDRYKPLTSADLFNLILVDTDSGTIERFINLAVKDGTRSVARVLANQSSLARVNGALPTTRPEETDSTITPKQKTDHPNWNKITPFSKDDIQFSLRSVAVADPGSDGGFLTRDDFTSGDGLQDAKMGLFSLEKTDLFNVVCIPPDQRGLTLPKEIYQDALSYCVQRRAMLIVDPPMEWTSAGSITANNNQAITDLGLSGDAARNAAIYFPNVIESDSRQEGQPDTFSPSGIIAGIWTRTDVSRGVWKAPAGLDAGVLGIQKLAVSLNDAENGMLNPLGVNCFRTFPVAGTVIWGARTARGADQLADEYKYVPVRRLSLYIEESLYRGLQWVVFEPNDEPLWAQIRLNVGAFMHDMFRKGAFQGSNPRDAYFVKCDKETTTQNDINLGIVNVVVGFAPLKPAEFVIIQLQQMAGQIQV